MKNSKAKMSDKATNYTVHILAFNINLEGYYTILSTMLEVKFLMQKNHWITVEFVNFQGLFSVQKEQNVTGLAVWEVV